MNSKIPGWALLLTLLLPGAAHAASPGVYDEAQARLHYDKCLKTADHDPAAALNDAEAWERTKGGVPAQHCAAVALVGLRRYEEAGTRLNALAAAPGIGALRAEMFDQAGNAWILAGQADKAVASLSSALALSAGDADIYADLARAQALQSDWSQVEADLNAALAIAPRRTDLLILRASARQARGELRAAMIDIDTVLKQNPGSGDALVERGAIRRDAGDLAGARADFEAALKRDAGGEVAREARRNISALDAAKKTTKK